MKKMMEEMESLKAQTNMMGQSLGGLGKNLKKVSDGPVLKQSAAAQRNPNKDLFEDSEKEDE